MGRVAKYKKLKKFDLHRNGESGWDAPLKSRDKSIPRSVRKIQRTKEIMRQVEKERSRRGRGKKGTILINRGNMEANPPPTAVTESAKGKGREEVGGAAQEKAEKAEKAPSAAKAKEMKVKTVTMRKNETFSDFTKRLSAATRSDLDDINSKKVSRSRFWQVRAEKKKKKRNRRANEMQEEQKLGFGKLKDKVEFGDVAEAPPTIATVPKNRKKTVPSGPAKPKPSALELRQTEIQRAKAVASYKEAKRARKSERKEQADADPSALYL
mmetsp:Transcript_2202/g.7897  ORF Transcript_2202/g.7897 Transcript_2202/m.7897 type:complete len:268 (+) Transcript_2202:22-825(+)